jgi:hypothetical protein
MRRRSHAYTFDKGLYQAWSRGGIVWIEDDLKIIDHDKSSSAETNQSPPSPVNSANNFAGFGLDGKRSESYSKYTHTHLDCTDHVLCEKLELTYPPSKISDCTSVSLCESEIFAGFNTISKDLAPIGKQEVEEGASTCETIQEMHQNAPIFMSCGSSPDLKNKPEPNFSPKEYKKMDFCHDRSCSICGRKRDTWYVEVITPRRKKNPSVDPWYLCQKCYQKGVKRYQDTCSILPGAFSIDRLEEVRSNVGRCTICGLERATWKDRSNGLKICDACYHREQGKIAEASS